MIKNKIAKFFLYLWLLIWPWQTKLILRTSDSPYLEISLFLSLVVLLIPLTIWSRQIFKEDYWRFEKGKTKPWWWIGLVSLELITFFSIFWAPDIYLALYRYIVLVFGILLFYVIRRTDFVSAKLVIRYFLIGLIAPSLLAIWQFVMQGAVANKYLGLAYHSADVLGASVVETGAGRFLRAYGSFDHPNILGGVMVLGIILVLYSSLQKEINRNKRLFYLITLAIFYLALLVSFSRTAWLALIISTPFILLSAWTRGKFQRKLIGFFIFLIIGISTAVILPGRELFLTRVQTESRLEQKSVAEREVYLKQAQEVIIQNPVLGTGVGNYTIAVKQNDNFAYPYWYYQPVHNYWLLIWAELGFFGLLAMVIFWLAIFKKSFKKGLYPIVLALFVFSLFDHWLWTQPFELIIFFGIVGLIFREDI